MSQEGPIYSAFIAKYRISEPGMMGNITMNLTLSVNPEDNSVVGHGHIFQPIHPPLNVFTTLSGEFHYQCTMESCHIMMNLQGIKPYPGVGTLGLPNLHNTNVRILLDEDWKSGVANFSYKDAKGEWVEVSSEKVTLEKAEEIPYIDTLEFEKLTNSKAS